MRPVQTLYYDQGQMHCPAHGKKYIKFMTDDGSCPRLHWCCAAILPDGTHCVHSAEWKGMEEIHDTELEALAIAQMQHIRQQSSTE